MKKYINKIFALVISLTVVLSMTGCADKQVATVKPYDSDADINMLDTGLVCENDNYTLSWDSDVNCVILTSKSTGEAWSSIPYDYYSAGSFSGKAGVAMQSPLDITYYTKGVNQIKKITGYMGAVRKGRVASEKAQNGVKVTYYFDELEISVPVYYTLNKDSVSVSVIPSEIEEHNNKVCEISLSPYFCSAANSTENYLFVPSGSGALMYTDARGDARLYEESVYDADLAQQVYNKFENRQTVRMSAFGAAGNNTGMLGIITDGAESASILAESGNENVGYSNVYAKFLLRSYNISQVEYTGNEKVKNFWAFADKISPAEKYTVTYYPLGKDNANYSAMADIYREYLTDKYGMTEKSTDSLLNLEIIGGAYVKKFILGVPYYSVEKATSIKEAESIIKELSNNTSSMNVRLLGFGQSGVNAGKVAGGYKIAFAVGNKSQLNSLNDFCKEKEIDLFFDYDLLSYNDGGNGFSKTKDCIRTVNGYKANQNIFSISLRNIDETKPQYYILNRKGVSDAADKLSKKALLDGVSLSNIGSAVYSDFSEYQYYNCNGMINTVVDISKLLKESGKTVSFDAANDYAAAVADNISNAPVVSSKDNALDVDIPFYQMVFKGSVSLSNTAINYGIDKQKQFLKAVESGVGITYSLTGEHNDALMETQLSCFVDSLYDDNKDSIIENLNSYSKLFEKIKDSKISEHVIINENVRKTVFENGVTVFVNYGNEDFTYDNSVVDKCSFSFLESR